MCLHKICFAPFAYIVFTFYLLTHEKNFYKWISGLELCQVSRQRDFQAKVSVKNVMRVVKKYYMDGIVSSR